MSEFFHHYPQISYDITGAKPAKFKTAINAMVRAKLKNIVADDVVRYFGYSIPEAERPDITSFKIYGDVKYTWIIFLVNDIHDPIYYYLDRLSIQGVLPFYINSFLPLTKKRCLSI